MTISDKQIKFSYLREYHLILEDFDKILEFIDPSDENLKTFSHRNFELFLRTCTAIESIFKQLLKDQTYKNSGNLDMRDYFNINDRKKLTKYSVRFDSWRSGNKVIKPYELWVSRVYLPLPWYQSYNSVKHNRDQNLKEANLKNLIDSIVGLFVLLYSQYEQNVFGKYQDTPMYHTSDDEYEFSNDSIFSIKPI